MPIITDYERDCKMRERIDTGPWTAVILGEPASKANSRRLVLVHGKPRFIKSKKALAYERNFQLQVRQRLPLFSEDVVVGMKIYYASARPDLDESLVLDLLQGVSYENDRQVKRKIIEHALDRDDPRVEIVVAPLETPVTAITRALGIECSPPPQYPSKSSQSPTVSD